MFVTARPDGAWELRQSVRTPAGPRARTLARFRVLTPEVMAHAVSRAAEPLDQDAVRQAAARAGAPIAEDPGTTAARTLLAELARGKPPPPRWRNLLTAALASDPPTRSPSNSEWAALQWANTTPAERSRALVDLLALTDAIPASPARTGRRKPPLHYPPLGGGTNQNPNART